MAAWHALPLGNTQRRAALPQQTAHHTAAAVDRGQEAEPKPEAGLASPRGGTAATPIACPPQIDTTCRCCNTMTHPIQGQCQATPRSNLAQRQPRPVEARGAAASCQDILLLKSGMTASRSRHVGAAARCSWDERRVCLPAAPNHERHSGHLERAAVIGGRLRSAD